MAYYVYIIQCSDNTYYCGYTKDINKRVDEHNNSKKGAKYTRYRRPVVLKYSESFATLSEALKKEYKIKQLNKIEKQALISGN